MNGFASYISKQQFYMAVVLTLVLCLALGWSRSQADQIPIRKISVTDLQREVPGSLEVNPSLAPLSIWGLSLEDSSVDPTLNRTEGDMAVIKAFGGPPPIFAVVKTGDKFSAYVQGEAGLRILNEEDKYTTLTLKEISMSSLIFETESGERIPVEIFSSENF